MITLFSNSHTITITLPDSCEWVDEFNWSSIKSRSFYSIAGDFLVEPFSSTKGRPITLGGNNALIKRVDLLSLVEWSNLMNHTMVLKMHNDQEFDVIFRHWDTPVVEGKALINENYTVPSNDSPYLLTLRLVTV